MRVRSYYVYILCSRSGVLYVGVTSDLEQRIYQHKAGTFDGFTKKYRVNRLVFFEMFQNVWEAIEREKQLKSWRREKKVWLIERENPQWRDLAEDVQADEGSPAVRDPSTAPPSAAPLGMTGGSAPPSAAPLGMTGGSGPPSAGR
jgi:putative endonuclease